MHSIRTGTGRPLLLVHGLGATPRAWDPVIPALAGERTLILPTLPGHGGMPAERDSGTFAGLVRSLDAFLDAENLVGVDMVGSSLGARILLEMARRGRSGAVVALDPGGFWEGWERGFFKTTINASVGLLRALGPALPVLARNFAGRTALLAQLSARPWALNGDLVAAELKAFAATPTAKALIDDLAGGQMQQGPAAPGAGPVTIGWGRHDRLCIKAQAARAAAAFPGARLHWFEHSGHFPMWDEPRETVALIREATQQEQRHAAR